MLMKATKKFAMKYKHGKIKKKLLKTLIVGFVTRLFFFFP